MEFEAGFGGEGFDGAVGADEGVAAGGAGAAALEAVRGGVAAVGEEGGGGFGDDFVLADEAFSAGVCAPASAAVA